MKKKLLIFVLILISISLFAELVEKNKLIDVAIELIKIENKKLAIEKKGAISFEEISPLIYNSQQIGYIVTLYPDGFMIMPAITELTPVKFISFKGRYDKIKNYSFIKQILTRLYYTRVKLNYIKTDITDSDMINKDKIDLVQKNNNQGVWDLVSNGTLLFEADAGVSLDVATMTTSNWSQGTTTVSGNAYNMYTPTDNGKHTYTGCSATAQAQVMYYWKYPAIGQGSNSYSWNSQTVSANFNHSYDWANMVNTYNGSQTQAQEQAVGRLMADVGISIDMNYGLSASGAVPNANNSLYQFFKYSSDVRWRNRSSYPSWVAWFDMFKDQMDNGWPAILATFQPGAGHAVVIDGYKTSSSNQVHVNMGWGGSANGYYSMDDILGYGDAGSDYAVTDIYPPGGGNSISIVSPNGGESWPKGSTYNITWDKTGTQDANVKLRLYQNGIKILGISDSTANDGSYSWTIPDSISNNTNYIVRVKTLDNLVYADSDEFTITDAVATITMTSPDSGVIWNKDSLYTITWDKTGTQNAHVKIRLYQNGSKILGISDSTANDGSYSWTIPGTIPNNTNYIVRVKTVDNLVYDDSAEFTITDAVATITMTSPGSGVTWNIGSLYTITWDKIGTQNANVKIRLYQNGTKILGITDSTLNDGSYSWTIPGTISNDTNYIVRVKTLDNLVYDDSDEVTIRDVGSSLIVTTPGSGVAWTRGSPYTITWDKTGTQNANVKIRLYQNGSKILGITDSTLNDGSYSWTIPGALSNASNYVIRIKTIDNLVYDDSDNLIIN